jgi:2-polyprenyl-3-methyl-5-hydroxy-6-metoxy-1,4-benzoquinol methylase
LKNKNLWKFWRPFYKYTWAVWQKASYDHYAKYINALDDAIVLDIGTGIGPYISKLNPKPSTRIIFTDPDRKSIYQAMSQDHCKKHLFTFDCIDADGAIKRYKLCTHISLIHVLSVINNPFQFIKKCYKEIGDDLEILVYLSQFNAKSSLKKSSRIFGFARLQKAKLDEHFTKTRVNIINNFYFSKPNKK